MMLRPVWILAVLNFVAVTCLMTSDLTCPEDGSEIEIDINGYDPRGFRFPMSGTFGFPASKTCNWKFITESSLRFVVGVADIVKDDGDVITLEDTNGSTLSMTNTDFGKRKGFELVTSTGNAVTVKLVTDGSSNNEEMYIYILAGVDSGLCPGISTIAATDDYQILTSPNFPDKYNNDEVCEVTVFAEENKTLSYTIVFKQLELSTQFEDCDDILELFDGPTFGNKIFDSCNSFLPETLPEIKTMNVGRNLKFRFKTDGSTRFIGFVVLFKQQDIDECLLKDCNPNNSCTVPDEFFECECSRNDTSCTKKRYLFCENDGSEVIIDVPEFESQTFSFPPPQSDEFPKSTSCKWTFKGKEGSRLLFKGYDITFNGPDSLRFENDDGSEMETFNGPIDNGYDNENLLSKSHSVTVTLTTDADSSKMEKFKLSVISGRDSGTCPGETSVKAADDFQTITSDKFPERYQGGDDCDITISADEGMVIVFSVVFAELENYRDIFYDSLTVIGENNLFRSELPYQNAINSQTTGNHLRIRFITNTSSNKRGFVIVFKQKAIEECNRNTTKVCDGNAECIDINGSFQCQCNDGFVGSGYECKVSSTVPAPTKSKKKILLPLYLAWSLGTTVSGAMVLILLYHMADAGKPGSW